MVRLITPSPTEPSTRLPLPFIRRLEFISIPVYFDLIVFTDSSANRNVEAIGSIQTMEINMFTVSVVSELKNDFMNQNPN